MPDSPSKSQAVPDSPTTVDTTFTPPSIILPSIHRSESYTHHSPIPPQLPEGTPCILGVDEAGRGPVLGPMVYAVAYLPASQTHLLTSYGFDDSKKLTTAVRESLLKTTCTPGTDLHDWLGWSITSMSARDISAGMLGTGKGYNLNAQAHDTTAQLIREVIERGVNVTEIYVDTVGPPVTYQAKLQKLFPNSKVTVSKKADSIYPIVSAASVCAKVTRDVTIDVLAGEQEMGSGYPGDEKTKGWLKRERDPVFGWDARITRYSWRTVTDLLEKGDGPGVVWPDDDDEEGARITSFFGGSQEGGLSGWYGRPVLDF
jgi:ribonuclease H2 subunit A